MLEKIIAEMDPSQLGTAIMVLGEVDRSKNGRKGQRVKSSSVGDRETEYLRRTMAGIPSRRRRGLMRDLCDRLGEVDPVQPYEP